MLHYPEINPIAFQIASLKVHWYGVMYLFAFLISWAMLSYRARQPGSALQRSHIDDLIVFAALGVLVGGRIGYMLFYNLNAFLHQPLVLFKIWDGGMSFHGGMLGVFLALWLYARRIKTSVWDLTDFIMIVVPIGLGLGRIGNFINGELFGRLSQKPWSMVFPMGGPFARHPSQLYEACLEGLVLFIVMMLFTQKSRPRFAPTALFLLFYGVFRFFCEFFRQPDPQLGFIAFGWLTQGQLLSIPMMLIGGVALVWIYGHQSVTTRIKA